MNRTLSVLLVMLAALTVGVIALSPTYTPPAPGSADVPHQPPLAYLPSGAEVVATVNVRQLRKTALGRVLTGRGRELPGVGQLEQLCGFDPTERIEQVAIAIPRAPVGAPRGLEFGVVVLGDFDAERLATCASAVVRERGGDPARSELGHFLSVRDRRDAEAGEVAIRDGGPAILGGGGYLRNLVDTAEGRGESVHSARLHTELRRAAGEQGTVVATWLVPAGYFGEHDPKKRVSLAALRGVALRLDFAPGLEAKLLLGCAPKLGCTQVAAAVQQVRQRLNQPSRDLLNLDLDRANVSSERDRVEVSLSLTADEAQQLFERLRARLGPLLGFP